MVRAKARLMLIAVGVGAIFAAVISCSTTREAPGSPSYHYRVPEATDDGWLTGSRDEENIAAGPIDQLFEQINDGTYRNIHSVLLVRNGRLVVEEYFAGTHPVLPETLEQELDWKGKAQSFDRDTLHTIQSLTKSVASILVGIAVDQKLIEGDDASISTFFPGFGDRDGMRLRHFLSMTAGLEWDEWVPLTDPRNDVERMNKSNDPVSMLLERPSVAPPGSRFAYNSAVSVALGEIVRKASGMSVDQFAQKNLFHPMGIRTHAWKGRFPNGVVHTGGGLYLRPRDLAKIGCMMLNNGRWGGRQIVSAAWVRETLRQQAPDQPYGYQWWIRQFKDGERTLHCSWAGGYGGQYIFIFPDLDLVVVSTGWNPDDAGQFVTMMQRHILPAVLAGSTTTTPGTEGVPPAAGRWHDRTLARRTDPLLAARGRP